MLFFSVLLILYLFSGRGRRNAEGVGSFTPRQQHMGARESSRMWKPERLLKLSKRTKTMASGLRVHAEI